ncbi:MAG: hypothetical protein M1820_000532 [Bogoriella megaspora]|nr:MAG: hypothetical protein M1820_000532 [Bogoriella megaspora]
MASSSKDIHDLIALVQKEAKAQDVGEAGAHLRLLAAADKLRSAVETPAEWHMRFRFQFEQNIASRILIENGVLEALAAKSSPVSAAELSKETGADALLIARLMRLLAAIGYADEVGENVYLASDSTRFATQPGFRGAEKYQYVDPNTRGKRANMNPSFDTYAEIVPKLVESMRTGGGIHQFPDEPHMLTPYPYSHDGKTLWEVYKIRPEQKKDFDMYMTVRRQGALHMDWWKVYPAASELPKVPGGLRDDKDAVLMVDVGGGRGHDLEVFRTEHSELPGRCILEDLPGTIENIKDSPPKGCEMTGYDFFTPQPIKGARAYFFRAIAHDWSDKKCRELFGNTVAAMDKEYSRILIEDFVLPATGAGYRAASMDTHMFLTLGGIERTERHWHELLQSIGLEIVKIWAGTPGMYESVIEAKKI